MKITKQARRDGKQLFRASVVNGLLDEDRVRKAVGEVVRRKPRGYVAILQHIHRLVKLDTQRRTANVESATALDATVKQAVQAGLGRLYGPGLTINFAENPALIGGLRVRIGSDVFDGSILARLNSLKETF